ncbi:LCP family protein [Paenibacillus sp. IB182496]|uniref:LCP family protein n=1 Tax=Paenibacillus sabuli TaxID=2772509 RepID=A0A927BZW9_9BACL|nr:LCP family protein [Paenibacillus sabuli]MBD2848569.1 LCP family protein [Paenibacillus sabuli]
MRRGAKRLLLGLAAALLLSATAAAGYGWMVYRQAERAAARMYEPLAPAEPPLAYAAIPQPTRVIEAGGGLGTAGSGQSESAGRAAEPVSGPFAFASEARAQPSPEEGDPFTVLMMGVDERAHDRGRSDTMIVLGVNPARGSMLMFNIPRDTRTELVGRGTLDKINHAYAFGGVEMAVRTVERFVGERIDYYVKVNMEGFAELIDLLGGVRVDNPFAFDFEGYHYAAGEIELTGEAALMYARMRWDDPRGDLGRNARQRELLQRLLQRLVSLETLGRTGELLDAAGDHVRTNLTFASMRGLALDYGARLRDVQTTELAGRGRTIDGIWYYEVTREERDRVRRLLADQLR